MSTVRAPNNARTRATKPGPRPAEGDRARPDRSRRTGPRPDGRRDDRPEGQLVRPVHPAARRPDASAAPPGVRRRGADRAQRHRQRRRPEDPRSGHRPDLRRPRRRPTPRRNEQGRGRRGAAPAGRGQRRRHGLRDGRRARSGHRLRRGRRGADGRARDLCRVVPAGLPGGLHPQRRRAAHRLRHALGGPGQDPPTAPGLLRQAAARRAAQPRHQRHRQRQHHAPADDEPAADLGAHRRRRARR